MSPWSLFLLLCPFLVLVAVLGTVAVVALRHARPEDVPAVFAVFGSAFGRLTGLLPHRSGRTVGATDASDGGVGGPTLPEEAQ